MLLLYKPTALFWYFLTFQLELILVLRCLCTVLFLWTLSIFKFHFSFLLSLQKSIWNAQVKIKTFLLFINNWVKIFFSLILFKRTQLNFFNIFFKTFENFFFLVKIQMFQVAMHKRYLFWIFSSVGSWNLWEIPYYELHVCFLITFLFFLLIILWCKWNLKDIKWTRVTHW